MYSKKALADVFQRILKFEQDIKPVYKECIDNIDDEHIIDILQEIYNEEKVHIELVKELFEIIDEEVPE